MRSIEPPVNLRNLIRVKQSTAAAQVLAVFGGLSFSLSYWFKTLAEVFSNISMPIEVKPICTSWYISFQKGEYYFANAWIAFVAAYAAAFSLRGGRGTGA
ncbi:hypothetical protein TrST_g12225 [Triparma strigata]|uniref:Uncharacterized protein n=1 Tax=Triparma strigata TaxID=1606541 RepID=A0A9W7EZ44_9STRA|nr:hypothetical protein TrST_g12225 [Triparma strigata]